MTSVLDAIKAQAKKKAPYPPPFPVEDQKPSLSYAYYLPPDKADFGKNDWMKLRDSNPEYFDMQVMKHPDAWKLNLKELQHMFNKRMISDKGLLVII